VARPGARNCLGAASRRAQHARALAGDDFGGAAVFDAILDAYTAEEERGRVKMTRRERRVRMTTRRQGSADFELV